MNLHQPNVDPRHFTRNHNVDLRLHFLCSELPTVDGNALASSLDFFHGGVCQCTRGADRRAHGLFADATAVVTHVAFHHLIDAAHVFRYAEGTGKNAIGTADASWFQ